MSTLKASPRVTKFRNSHPNTRHPSITSFSLGFGPESFEKWSGCRAAHSNERLSVDKLALVTLVLRGCEGALRSLIFEPACAGKPSSITVKGILRTDFPDRCVQFRQMPLRTCGGLEGILTVAVTAAGRGDNGTRGDEAGGSWPRSQLGPCLANEPSSRMERADDKALCLAKLYAQKCCTPTDLPTDQ